MSLLENLVNTLLGGEEASQPKPCTNCAANCEIYPDACGECREYKEKLINQLYDVEHLESYYDKYEVGAPATVGNMPCPCCGAPNPAGSAVCEYCGSQIGTGSGKIRVASASEIPDPIQLAQDTIFARREIVRRYSKQESAGLLDSLVSLVTGGSDSFGNRMTTEEIKSTAQAYHVTVSAYLSGVDNGTYLTASAKEKDDKAKAAAQTAAAAAAAGRMAAGSRRDSGYSSMRPEPPRNPGRSFPNQDPRQGRTSMHQPGGMQQPPRGGMHQPGGMPQPPRGGMHQDPRGGMHQDPRSGMNRDSRTGVQGSRRPGNPDPKNRRGK